jgi:hypothetical protein
MRATLPLRVVLSLHIEHDLLLIGTTPVFTGKEFL